MIPNEGAFPVAGANLSIFEQREQWEVDDIAVEVRIVTTLTNGSQSCLIQATEKHYRNHLLVMATQRVHLEDGASTWSNEVVVLQVRSDNVDVIIQRRRDFGFVERHQSLITSDVWFGFSMVML
jgi:hypothetical protein